MGIARYGRPNVGLLATALTISIAFAVPASAPAQSVGRYREFGDSGGFLNIVPPGQDGVLNGPEIIQVQGGTYPPHVIDQLGMYGDLVYNAPGLTDERLLEFYKDASFGVQEDDIERVYSPTPGVTVVRDASFGVPHIYGETVYATWFAMGYTGAEDRLFLMDVLRHTGRARMSEFLGASPGNIQMDREQLAVAPYREADLTAQIEAIRTSGPEGQAMYDRAIAYSDGVNAYINEALIDPTKLPGEYPALQQLPGQWIPEDIIAVASLVGGIFGKGGGGELTNLCGLQAMTAELGGDAAAARAIFDDLHFADDAEAPTSSRDTSPYMSNMGAVDPAAHPAINCASLQPLDPSGPSLDELLDAIAGNVSLPVGGMSNALLISGAHTRTGNPIAVFGPQTGYFFPQLLVEKDVHGPGIDARGVAFAGTDLVVQLGRGRDYAFSATSASADLVDQWVLELCEPGGGPPTTASMGYLRSGVCEPIEAYNHVQIAKPSAGGIPGLQENACNDAVDSDGDGVVNDGCPAVGLPELPIFCLDAVDDDGDNAVNDGCLPVPGADIVLSFPVQRTAHYGPIVARGTLTDGTPIAIASLRSTYQNELRSAIGFFRLNDPEFMAGGYESFRQATGEGIDYSFNWFYIDDRDIGYQHSCLCPQRAQGVDPYLPAWGNGDYDWQGFIGLDEQPSDLNPAEGFITSWNNKQAPGFRANDRQFSYGPVYRSKLLDLRVQALVTSGDVVRSDMVDAMEDAGTVDLRGQEDLSLLLEVLGATAPSGSDARAQEMRDRLAAWLQDETHRRDFDDSGEYDDPQAPAIMDAWWPRLAHAMFDAPSAHALDSLHIGLDDGDRRNHIGSAFNGGVYSQVNKDLRQILGRPVQDAWSKTYCGNGVLADCRALLWQSLAAAAADLEAEFSSASVADWKRAIADEDVRARSAGVAAVPAIHWINRPTFQQVVQIRSDDAYKCYRSRTASGPTQLPQTVLLADPFDSKLAQVSKPESVCPAAAIGGLEILDSATNLACYKIRDASGQPPLVAVDTAVTSVFGRQTLRASKAAALCLPAALDGVALGGGADAYKCYRAKRSPGSARFAKRTVAVEDAFENKSTQVVKPELICNPASIDGSEVLDPRAALACFKIRDAKGTPRFGGANVDVDDDFGATTRSLSKSRRVCVPASSSAP